MASKIAIASSQNLKPKEEKVKAVHAEEISACIQKLFPNKINFSLDEAASVLNVSYDFIREHIISNDIKSIKYGNRRMIGLFELIRILMEGV